MQRQLLLFGLALSLTAALATPLPPTGVALKDVHRSLRKAPLVPLHVDGARYQLVNDRYKPCATRKEARAHGRYILRIAPAGQGWAVQVTDLKGTVRMEGRSLAPDGSMYDGPFRYYDDTGQLRAEGAYDRGRKTGTWQRYTAMGEPLTEREYRAEDWEAMQVRMGLASMTGPAH